MFSIFRDEGVLKTMDCELERFNRILISPELLAEVIARHANMSEGQLADADAIFEMILECVAERGTENPVLARALSLRATALARLLDTHSLEGWRSANSTAATAIDDILIRIAASMPMIGTIDKPSFDRQGFIARRQQ